MPESESEPPYRGGCLCGKVRYVVDAKPANVRICHCRLCQKATGCAFFARAIFPRDAVSIEGSTQAYASSEDLRRLFCPSCGTAVFAERLSRPGFLSVTLASLDAPERLPPTMHIWVSRKIPWVVLNDGLPQFPEGAPW